MALGLTRERILHGLLRKRKGVHRYTAIRWAVGLTFTTAVLALPLSGLFRFDLWAGHHLIAGREVGFIEAAKRFAFPFLGANIAILLATRFLGRYLCGFVCPVGNLARLAEWSRARPAQRLVAQGLLLALCALLSFAFFAFWVDTAVFTQGSALARMLAAGFALATCLVLYVAALELGLGFCQKWCPSGVYFALLSHESPTGIEFANPAACTDCGSCARVCPMDLEPRHIEDGPQRDGRGFYGEGFTNTALCIRCGDCVSACEGVSAKRLRDEQPLPLRLGFRERRPAPAETAAESASPAEHESAPAQRDELQVGAAGAADAPRRETRSA